MENEIPENDAPVINEQEWANVVAEAADIDETDAPLTGGKPVNEEMEISSAELMADVVQVTADVFAPNWDLQREESAQLGSVYGALLDKYMPDSGLDKYGLELSALMVTAMVLKSRAGIPLKKEKEPAENSEKSARAGGEKTDKKQSVTNSESQEYEKQPKSMVL